MFLSLFLATIATPLVSHPVLALNSPGLVTPVQHYGPELTVEHLFYNDMPVGVGVSGSGRKFVTYTRPSNYTLAELIDDTHDVPWPSFDIQNLPSLVNSTDPTYAVNYQDRLINIQNVVFDAKDRLWALDTGRPTVNGYRLFNSGGAKLVAFDLSTNSSKPVKTIVFPLTVAYPVSFVNDVRIDLRPELTESGEGVAYLSDTSEEGRNGIIVVDLGTGNSWRHLEQHPSTMFQEGLRTVYNNESFLPLSPNTGVYNQLTTGANAIALSADGEWLHYAALASRQWWRVPTSLLRVPTSRFGATSMAAIDARNAIEFLGDLQSHPDGFEADAAGTIYLSAPEQNAIYTWKSGMNTPELYVRNGMIQWPDTMSIGTDKRLYFVVNQLWLGPGFHNGVDRRVKPYGLLSAPIDANRIELI